MKKLFSSDAGYILLRDGAAGPLYLDALCNESAAYFNVTVRLLPAEEEGLLDPRGHVTKEGQARLARLADAIQQSPAKFREQRRREWQKLGYPDTPEVPELG